MRGTREKKSNSNFYDRRAGLLGGDFHAHAERFQHIGRSAARTMRAIAMLGNTHAHARSHKSRSGGNIKRIPAAAAGPASIYQFARKNAALFNAEIRKYWTRVTPHDRREADEFLHAFTFIAQRRKQARDFRVCQ